MSALPVSHYLRDLSPDAARKALKGVAGIAVDDEMSSDIEKRVDEARTLGILEGRAAVQAEYDVRLAQQVDGLEKKFAQERAAWARDQGGRLGELIVERLDAIESKIAEQVAAVLRPFIGDEVRGRALAELKGMLEKMLLNGDYAKITVSGPADLIEVLRAQIADRAKSVTFVTTERPDVTVIADETILETRIVEWLGAIRGEAQ